MKVMEYTDMILEPKKGRPLYYLLETSGFTAIISIRDVNY